MKSSFEILNNSEKDMVIRHEPECFEFNLPPNEKVTIIFNSCMDSILLRHYIYDDNICVDIIDDQSPYQVVHNGVDVFAKYFD
jgi:hypothetical protein